ncbi:MAG TPA: phage minor capsid protein [Jatrophihabitantaceae bacterium]|nr:phage minor capsid protein [Jatrophihabitantaceae bacterium]
MLAFSTPIDCKHTLLAYLPGVTKATGRPNPWTVDDEARYRATQQLRALERQVRAWKRAQAGALNDLDRQRAARHVRATQAAIRAHIDQHGLVRRRQREQLDLGNK